MTASISSLHAISVAGFDISRTSRSLSHSLQRLATGGRITRAADDAAGLGVATSLSTKAISQRAAIRNANDGISLVQVAEAATGQSIDVMQRMRELTVQSASGTLTDDERVFLEVEYVGLQDELQRIADYTSFNGINLSDGSNGTLDVQVGTDGDADSRISVQLGDLSRDSLLGTTGGAYLSIATAADARTVLGDGNLDTGIDSANTIRAELGALHVRMTSAIGAADEGVGAAEMAQSTIASADFATETARNVQLQLRMRAGVVAMKQAKSLSESLLQLVGT